MAFFCKESGARIVAPGVSKRIDPEAGANEVIELEDGTLKVVFPAPQKSEPAKGTGAPKEK
jgi:hypothetical protein